MKMKKFLIFLGISLGLVSCSNSASIKGWPNDCPENLKDLKAAIFDNDLSKSLEDSWFKFEYKIYKEDTLIGEETFYAFLDFFPSQLVPNLFSFRFKALHGYYIGHEDIEFNGVSYPYFYEEVTKGDNRGYYSLYCSKNNDDYLNLYNIETFNEEIFFDSFYEFTQIINPLTLFNETYNRIENNLNFNSSILDSNIYGDDLNLSYVNEDIKVRFTYKNYKNYLTSAEIIGHFDGEFPACNFNDFDFKIEKIDGKEVPYFIEPTFSGNEISNEPFLDRSFEFKFDDYYIYIY